MYEFDYHRASSVDDAAGALSKSEDGKLLAGGQTLIPTLKQRLAQPSDVIDIGAIDDLAGIKTDGNGVTIGAAVTHAEVATSKDIAKAIPALANLAGMIGDPHVRHLGTIGGSVANNDPAADYPAACLGLGATITTNKREISADEFFTGMFDTALEEDEIITSVTFPKAKKAAYKKFPNPASRYALVGVFVADASDGIRVAVTGAGNDGVYREGEMETALGKSFSSDALSGMSADEGGMNSDIHASANYRAHLVGVMARRAVDAANG